MRPLLVNHRPPIEPGRETTAENRARPVSEDAGPFLIFFGFLLTETEFTLDDDNEYKMPGGDGE